jgi:hypothetical protein
MEFKKYQHLEKFGTTEVNEIEIGMCHVFPKIDGTNASLWWNDGLRAGSRNRELSLDNDNAGFLNWAAMNDNVICMLEDMPHLRLYGEWLVPHTLKTYLDSAWRDFYVFDVKDVNDEYIPYKEYKQILDDYGVNYIAPICIIKNPTDETLFKCLDKNNYLIKDNEGAGEGIVIKNYGFKNRFGNTVWAKIVRSEFKVKNQKVFGVSEIKEKNTPEEMIVAEYVTGALVEKEYSKIEIDTGWNSRMIPKLLNVVFYCLVKEESWNFVKKHKNPTINYRRLMSLTFARVKEIKPELF